MYTQNIYLVIKYLRLAVVLVVCALPALQARAQVTFIENKGQWGSDIKYRANIPGGELYVTNGILHFILADRAPFKEMHDKKNYTKPVQMHYYKVVFEGSNPTPTYKNEQTATAYHNFFLGNDPSRWATGVAGHYKITMQELYPGIDLEIFGSGSNSLKYNLIIKPGANPKLIKMRYEGLDDMHLSGGRLHLHTTVGDITEMAPICYQYGDTGVKYVKTEYALKNNLLTFDIKENYNQRKSFIIDPELVFSTYSGALGDNWGFTGTYDNSGNAYSGGAAYYYLNQAETAVVSDGRFPVTPGAFQRTFRNGVGGVNEDLARDATIYKVSSDGKNLIYATYLGGTHNEEPHSMVVNSRNELVVFGTTFSSNFPVAGNGFDNTFNGGADIFVFVLSADGRSMVGSTFIGGSGIDGLNGDANPLGTPITYNYGDQYRGEVIVDKSNNIYVATSTQSGNGFPIKNGFQQNYAGSQDGCLFKMNENVSTMDWCSYIGGSGVDVCNGLDLDSKGNILVAGGTTGGLPQHINTGTGEATTLAGGTSDAFLLKINPQGNQVLNGTYAGTNAYDQAYFVKVDKFDNPYITGQTAGTWPVTAPIFTQTRGGQFICKYTPDLLTRSRSMVYGNGGIKPQISPSAFLVDECERIFVSGWGGVVNAPPLPEPGGGGHGGNTSLMSVTSDAFQKNSDGSDFYLAVFSRNMDTLLYATFLGGNGSNEHVDGGTSRFDPKGIVYQSVCAGCGSNSLFPTTDGAYSRTNNSNNCNNAILKLDFENLNRPPVVNDAVYTVLAGETLAFNYYGTDPDPYDSLSFFVDKSAFTASNFPGPKPQISNATRGIRQVQMNFNWATTCDNLTGDTIYMKTQLVDEGCPDSKSDSATIKILVLPKINTAPVVNDVFYSVIAGNPLQFNYSGTDPDLDDSVYFTIDTSLFYKPAFKGTKPKINAQSNGIKQVQMSFDWIPECDHVTGDTIKLKTTLRDVSCPDSKTDSATIKILVLPPPTLPPPTVICLVPNTPNSIKITWDGVDTADKYFSHIMISKIDPNGNVSLLGPFKKSDPFQYIDNAVADYRDKNYCYFLYTVNICGKKGNNSYSICSRDQFNAPINVTEVITATVEDNKNVKLVWRDTKEDDFESYLIYRSPRTPGTHLDKYSFYATTLASTDTTFIDTKVKVSNESFCYKVQVTDKCGHVSKYSNIGCNIVLKGISYPYEHHLDWQDYKTWTNGVNNYELFRWDDRKTISSIYKGAPTVFNTIDYALDYDWGGYWYRVTATEEQGNKATSQSNDVYLIQKPLLHVPTGITTNGDNLNDVWGQVDVFVREYHMQVFNRWGEKVFESYDKNQQWDASLAKKGSMDNVFIWLVRYTGWDNSVHIQKGTVTVLN